MTRASPIIVPIDMSKLAFLFMVQSLLGSNSVRKTNMLAVECSHT